MLYYIIIAVAFLLKRMLKNNGLQHRVRDPYGVF